MDIEFVERLITLVKTSGLTELEYSEGGQRLKLLRTAAPPDAAPVAAAVTAAPPAVPPAKPGTPAGHALTAGLGGTFFCRPAPGEAPFVQVGDTVSEGQVLGVVEAMKMLNSVESDRSGVITRILVEDGATVAPGSALFFIEAR